MNLYQHSPEQINQLAAALEDPDLDMNGLGWKAAFHLRELQARIADLEAQLYAVGASIQPQIQADTPQPTENLHCKSTQKRLATLWGYEKARQPLTEEQIKAAVRHLYGSDAVAAMAVTGDIETARAIEAAHGITRGQP